MQNKEVKSNASDLHRKVYNIIKGCYPQESIRQEEPIKIDGRTLYIDIYLPRLKIGVECNGEQHYKFNKFFHQNAAAFRGAKENDRLKRKYCEVKNITLISIKYNDKITRELVEEKVLQALRGGDQIDSDE